MPDAVFGGSGVVLEFMAPLKSYVVLRPVVPGLYDLTCEASPDGMAGGKDGVLAPW